MPRVHALSDIHGHAAEFARIINAIDLDTHQEDGLVLLGDYIDRGPDSAKCLYLAKELSDRYPERVTVLLGNHETDFLDWLDADSDAVDWLLADRGLGTSGMHGIDSHAPYFDGQSHWYIDGSVESTGKLNVLTYDTETGEYSHFDGPTRNYVLIDLGYGAPEAYSVQLDGEEIGYMRVRAGMARAEYKGATIWSSGDEVDRDSNAAYFRWEEGELTATPLLHDALQAVEYAYREEHPDAPTDALWTFDFELVRYDHSKD